MHAAEKKWNCIKINMFPSLHKEQVGSVIKCCCTESLCQKLYDRGNSSQNGLQNTHSLHTWVSLSMLLFKNICSYNNYKIWSWVDVGHKTMSIEDIKKSVKGFVIH